MLKRSFNVKITEIREQTFKVEANDLDEATVIVNEKLNNHELYVGPLKERRISVVFPGYN